LESFISDDYVQKNIDILRNLERYLSMQLMEEYIDSEQYDNYMWLLHRLETLLLEVKLVEDTRQSFSDRKN
jgi:hypothetical protein